MKSTGIVRNVDELGRIVIPKELRTKFNIEIKDPIEIYVDGSSIVLKKYLPNCIFCGSSKELISYKDKLICNNCSKKILELTSQNDTKE